MEEMSDMDASWLNEVPPTPNRSGTVESPDVEVHLNVRGGPGLDAADAPYAPDVPAPRSKTGTASPVKVTHLTAGKRYTCTVRATNSRGTGLASAASAEVRA